MHTCHRLMCVVAASVIVVLTGSTVPYCCTSSRTMHAYQLRTRSTQRELLLLLLLLGHASKCARAHL
jgi:hypothetical protein